jgi:hypothetical protein
MRLALALCLFASACAETAADTRPQGPPPPVQLTRDMVLKDGMGRYGAPPRVVYQATMQALQTLGYQIESEDIRSGIIMTKQTPLVAANGQATPYMRQYMVRVLVDQQEQKTELTFVPKMFINGQDASNQPIWDLATEKKLWADLFQQIQNILHQMSGTGNGYN